MEIDPTILDLCRFRLKKVGNCTHPRIIVSEQERTIRCEACDSILDPFDFLMKVAQRERSLASGIQNLKDEMKRVAAKKQKLCRLERNQRSRLDRLVKDAECKQLLRAWLQWV